VAGPAHLYPGVRRGEEYHTHRALFPVALSGAKTVHINQIFCRRLLDQRLFALTQRSRRVRHFILFGYLGQPCYSRLCGGFRRSRSHLLVHWRAGGFGVFLLRNCGSSFLRRLSRSGIARGLRLPRLFGGRWLGGRWLGGRGLFGPLLIRQLHALLFFRLWQQLHEWTVALRPVIPATIG